jgi:hypothetical protein
VLLIFFSNSSLAIALPYFNDQQETTDYEINRANRTPSMEQNQVDTSGCLPFSTCQRLHRVA